MKETVVGYPAMAPPKLFRILRSDPNIRVPNQNSKPLEGANHRRAIQPPRKNCVLA
jgi:hypothetical protein